MIKDGDEECDGTPDFLPGRGYRQRSQQADSWTSGRPRFGIAVARAVVTFLFGILLTVTAIRRQALGATRAVFTIGVVRPVVTRLADVLHAVTTIRTCAIGATGVGSLVIFWAPSSQSSPSAASAPPASYPAGVQLVRHTAPARSPFAAPSSHVSPLSTTPSPHAQVVQFVRQAPGNTSPVAAPLSRCSVAGERTHQHSRVAALS